MGNIFERNPVKTIFIILFTAFLILDIVSANIMKYYGKHVRKVNDHEKEYRIQSAVYHHTLKENAAIPVTMFGNVKYSVYTNSAGFRDESNRFIDKESSKYRIIFIGDSFTEGVGVEYEKTFVGLLQDFYGDQYEILNAAVASYSPIIHYRKIKHIIEEQHINFDELFVVLDISDAYNDVISYRNDTEGNVIANEAETEWTETKENPFNRKIKSGRSIAAKIERILRRDTLAAFWLFRSACDLFRERPVVEDFLAVNSYLGMWPHDRQLWKDYGKAGIDIMKHNMEKLYKLCKEHGIKMSVSVHPWPDQIARKDINSLHVKTWREWCKSRNIDFYNLFPAFINNEVSPRQAIEKNFIPGDIHWNEAGHNIVADSIIQMRGNFIK